MKRLTYILALLLGSLGVMAQTNQPLPAGSKPLSNILYLAPDSTVWTGYEFNGLFVKIAKWNSVDSLFKLGYTKEQVDSAITSQIGLINYPVTSVNGKTGAVTLDANDIGLGNVDNTSDEDKPISDATQSALDGKENAFSKGSLVAGNGVSLSGTLSNRLVGAGNVTVEATNSLTASNGLQIVGGDIRPVYGTGTNTVAQGNDSRITGAAQSGTGSSQVRNNSQLDQRYLPSTNGTATSAGSYNSDMNAIPKASYFNVIGLSATNLPFSNPGGMVSVAAADNFGTQLLGSRDGNNIAFRGIQSNTYTAWRTLWHSGNFTPGDYVPLSQKGAANGVASLDGSGKVPTSQLPTTGMQYQGTWNASTNTPTLADGTGTDGYFYRVTTAGTQNLGSGNIAFSVGDDVIHNGLVWQRAPSGTTGTNLSLTNATSTNITISSSTGSGVTLNSATINTAGIMSAADKQKLDAAITDYTETDPTVPSAVKSITSGDISDWNAAYSYSQVARMPLSSGSAAESQSYSSDLNSLPFGSFAEAVSLSATNLPFSNPGGMVSVGASTIGGQLLISRDGSNAAFRGYSSSAYSPWRTLWHSGNFTPGDYVTTANFAWSNLSGKPSTFTPSAHTHNASDIDAGTLAAARIGDATVSNAKLASMAASTIKGRTGSTGAPQDLTAAQVRTILNVANGATANSSDATLLNRANHTGTQAISTVSGLQSALDGKQATITGGASTITSSNLTANRALISNGSGKVVVSDVTATELGYLDGVTGNVQTQLNAITSGGTIARVGDGPTQVKTNYQNDTTYMRFKNVIKTTTSITTPGPFNNGSTFNRTVTVVGAEVGDAVIVNAGWLVPGAVVSSYVSSNDTVTINVTNAGPTHSVATTNTVYVTVITNRPE